MKMGNDKTKGLSKMFQRASEKLYKEWGKLIVKGGKLAVLLKTTQGAISILAGMCKGYAEMKKHKRYQV